VSEQSVEDLANEVVESDIDMLETTQDGIEHVISGFPRYSDEGVTEHLIDAVDSIQKARENLHEELKQ